MKKAVFALVSTEQQADRIVDRLLSAGFSNRDISVLCPDNKRGTTTSTREYMEEDVEFVNPDSPSFRKETSYKTKGTEYSKGKLSTEKRTKAPEGGVTGATTGGILGGSLGLLAGIGALAIPGVGPFIAAGPLMAALGGSAVGGSLGLLIGALVGAGIPEYEVKKYEAGLKAGNILISVHTENETEIKKATDIFKKEGAKDISSTYEKARSSY